MNSDKTKINLLAEYVEGLMNEYDGKELYLKYKDAIEKVTPQEAFEVFYLQLNKDKKPKVILKVLDKVINIFYKSLSSYPWKRPEKDSFLDVLIQENKALRAKLNDIGEIVKEQNFKGRKEDLLVKVSELKAFNDHYLKKENILFPYMEKRMEKFHGLTIMWSLHDEARACLNKMVSLLESEDCTESEFNSEIGKLFFAMGGLANKEELILFPAASEIFSEEEWRDMGKQSFEYSFPFIDSPQRPSEKIDDEEINELIKSMDGFIFKTETGILNLEQILMIFNALPVDLSFVDENNKVKFFTRPKDRIFPRSSAVIGRDVRNCHPHESVHVVEEIIEEFRNGRKEVASFWINMRGKMILIQYFALRNSKGEYKGVLEVSQDITEIKKLEGERRLLQWDNA
ncbi:DUF438 domain-containing protein [Clostridium malenominatum]|uniref:DUF438 domain-containing protein n=1 Tax=Clostridium malenominatum TaxID=1539 RepID=A0ABN1J0K0_9CLOT